MVPYDCDRKPPVEHHCFVKTFYNRERFPRAKISHHTENRTNFDPYADFINPLSKIIDNLRQKVNYENPDFEVLNLIDSMIYLRQLSVEYFNQELDEDRLRYEY